jgi:hypothetical protein
VTVSNGGGGGGPPVVTSFPPAPVDGQECYFIADATNGYVWRFRYRAASAAASKWEFVGGSGLLAGPAGNTTTSSTTAVPLASGPSITVPLAGDYNVRYGGLLLSTTATAVIMYLVLARNGTATALPFAQFSAAVANGEANIIQLGSLTGLNAGDALTLQVQNSAAVSCNYQFAFIEAVPVRVH